jgi:predicted GIY-YIG superfamily endonuclease
MHKKIKQMVQRMQAKEKIGRKRKIKAAWFLYILRCNDGSFYTGVTNNIERRFKMHNAGRASKYTRTRRPVELLYQEICGTRTQALVRECSIKAFPRKKKEELIAACLPAAALESKGKE